MAVASDDDDGEKFLRRFDLSKQLMPTRLSLLVVVVVVVVVVVNGTMILPNEKWARCKKRSRVTKLRRAKAGLFSKSPASLLLSSRYMSSIVKGFAGHVQVHCTPHEVRERDGSACCITLLMMKGNKTANSLLWAGGVHSHKSSSRTSPARLREIRTIHAI